MAETGNNPKHFCGIINRIPDEVIQTIVDKLSLVDAVRIGSISRRWKDLWKYISIIKFGPEWASSTGKDIIPSLNQFISQHRGQKIKEFCVEVTYKPEMSSFVDSWILFAIGKHVEELHIDFSVNDGDPCHQLVPHVFNCKSLTSLRLTFCDLKLPASIQLQSLKEVHFHRIELPENAILTLTSRTPVLKYLFLSDCNRTKDLCIHVSPDCCLTLLVISDSSSVFNQGTRMVLNAPSVPNLTFDGYLLRSEYQIENITECSSVRFLGDVMFEACREVGLDIPFNDYQSLKFENLLQQLLLGCQKADSVHLSNLYIQVPILL
ncbi:hypothetical protein SLA2020_042420 [Shorea laevis]